MSPELTPRQSNIALALWWILIIAVVACYVVAIAMIANGATLSMTGSCTGQGFENVTVEADLLVAAINQSTNGTSWQITAWGAA